MPKDPAYFSDDELDALLRDTTVSPAAIAAEMDHAGAQPLEVAALERALLTL